MADRLPTAPLTASELAALADSGSELLGEILGEAALGALDVPGFDAAAFLAAADAFWEDDRDADPGV